ncbi:hypothetical protein AOLI_G00250280 [Acnodon oligacanthus]
MRERDREALSEKTRGQETEDGQAALGVRVGRRKRERGEVVKRVAQGAGVGGVEPECAAKSPAQLCDGGGTAAAGTDSPQHNATETPASSPGRDRTWSQRAWSWSWGHGRGRTQIAPPGGMRAAQDEAAAAGACFTQVSRRIGRLFRRLPKSRSWSEGLRLLRRSSSSGTLVLADCSYTCHLECEGLVQLDCNQSDGQTEETPTHSPCTVYCTPSVVKLPLEGSTSQ